MLSWHQNFPYHCFTRSSPNTSSQIRPYCSNCCIFFLLAQTVHCRLYLPFLLLTFRLNPLRNLTRRANGYCLGAVRAATCRIWIRSHVTADDQPFNPSVLLSSLSGSYDHIWVYLYILISTCTLCNQRDLCLLSEPLFLCSTHLQDFVCTSTKNSWITRDQLDISCFIISLFNAQHVSDVNTSILRSLRLICWVISWVVLLWFDVCWCYVVKPASGYHSTPAKPQRNTNTHRTRTIQPMK